MIRDDFLVAPELDNPNKYLRSGTRTEITDIISKIGNSLQSDSNGKTVRNIIVWMNRNTSRLHNGKDSRKFKRSATEILQSTERTGCCDSCTLFTALTRSVRIPTMQIIALNRNWVKNIDEVKKPKRSGHFFAGVYMQDIYGKFNWVLVDPDRYVTDTRDVRFSSLNVNGDLDTNTCNIILI